MNPGAILPALPVLRGSSNSQDTKLHLVPAIAPPVKVALRPLAIAKAALAPMAISATVLAVLPPRLQAALGLHALHALDRLRRLAVAAVAFVARKRRRGPAGAPLSAMHFSAP